MSDAKSEWFRLLPSITETQTWFHEHHPTPYRQHAIPIKNFLQRLRDQILEAQADDATPPWPYQSREEILRALETHLQQTARQTMRKVINATGVVIHTNLGRAPLPPEILARLQEVFSGYTNLEFDLHTGQRGKRAPGLTETLAQLAGAEAAVVVNNNAAAVFLMLKALTAEREVIVSRGELVEIGGSFRIPDIMSQAGARLVEVGCTNRTRIQDYQQAINEHTAALLKVHPSNFVIKGFTESVSESQIAQLAKQHNLLSIHDLGSGNFYRFDQPALKGLATVQQEVAKGMDLVSFSGDKLLGGVQCGVVVGKKSLIERLRKHPLYRILRLDKMALATLEAIAQAYLSPESIVEVLPAIEFLELPPELIRQKAEKVLEIMTSDLPENRPAGWPDGWKCQLRQTTSLTGGGAMPEAPLPSYGLQITCADLSANSLMHKLRSGSVPVIARVENGAVMLDMRCVFAAELDVLARQLQELVG